MISPALRSPKSLWSYNSIPSGCVLYLPLWHPSLSGPVFKSPDPYGHICTVTGATWGKYGRTFNGTSDVITIPPISTDDFTMMAWVNPTDITTDNITILSNNVGASPHSLFRFNVDGTTVLLEINDNEGDQFQDTTITHGVSINEWHLFSITISGTTCSLDRDVTQIYTQTVAAYGLQTIATNWLLGRDNRAAPNDNWFKGNIGEVWFYNRALSAGEILYNYNSTKWRYQ